MNYIFENFKTHFFIEFYYNYKDGLLIEQDLRRDRDVSLLLERYGVFDGCETMAREIERNIHNGILNFKLSCKTNNNFIRNIKIDIVNDAEGMAFVLPESRLTNHFVYDLLTLRINSNMIWSNGLFPLIIHELTHAYQFKEMLKNWVNPYEEIAKYHLK